MQIAEDTLSNLQLVLFQFPFDNTYGKEKISTRGLGDLSNSLNILLTLNLPLKSSL